MRSRRPRNRALLSLGASAILVVLGSLALWAGSLRLPDLTSFEERKVEQSTKLYDRTGEILLYDLHGNAKRTIITYEEMPRHIKNATVAIEDAEFYEHRGIKPSAILRAVFANILSLGFSQGGSTITQQVIKNSLLTSEKTIARKLKEWVLAVKLEKALTKDEILALYLNETPYGGALYGVEAAAESYFGKPAAELTLAESAYLAALPQAPTFYSPFGTHRDRLEERKNLVLQSMLTHGFITAREHTAALAERPSFKPPEEGGIKAPHFVFYIREYLVEKYGEDALERRGLKVTTTLDYELEREAEAVVAEYAAQNKKNFNAENAGLLALDPATGQILAMVGSRNYFDPDIDGNFNVTLARRQPGSAFKPFVYAEALRKGYTPETVVFDLKTQFSTSCAPDDFSKAAPCFSPDNYDSVFRGPVTFRQALAQSLNVPSVKVLYLAGIPESLKLAKDLGITTLADAGRYGLSLVLGGGEVTLLDMTSSYGVLAADGTRNAPTGILKVEDGTGALLESFSPRPVQVLAPEIARQVTDILADNEARTPAFGERSYLYFEGRDVAAKTGTTNDYRDAWIVGYTPALSVGAWAGNNDNSPMEKKVAGFIVAPLWHAFMERALVERPAEPFRKPPEREENLKPALLGLWQGGEAYVIDRISGKLATEYTPKELREVRALGEPHEILYYLDKNNPRGDAPTDPTRDPQFEYWEYPVALWRAAQGIVPAASKPTAYDDVHGPSLAPRLFLFSPAPNASVSPRERVMVSLSSEGRFPLVKVDLFLNGVPLGSLSRTPFSYSFIPEDAGALPGENALRFVAYDAVQNRAEAETRFLVR